MEYLPWFNELLEALAYLGRRAAGNTAQRSGRLRASRP